MHLSYTLSILASDNCQRVPPRRDLRFAAALRYRTKPVSVNKRNYVKISKELGDYLREAFVVAVAVGEHYRRLENQVLVARTSIQ